MSNILIKLDELYTSHLVYRTIIVCDDTDIYKYILNRSNYEVFILNKFSDEINYDELDIRIFIIKTCDFLQFIRDYNKKKLDICFYNSIIFDSEEDKNIELKKLYQTISMNNTLIF